MANIKLSVVIPAYKEIQNLKKGVLDQVNDYLIKQDYSYEVLVVDDGSPDETADLIEEIIKGKKNFRLMRNPHGGKAITVMAGMIESKGEIALFTDMDQATPLKEIEKLLPKFDEGFDIVIGVRKGRQGAPLKRKIMAWGFSVLRNIILGLPFSDTQCGFKAFNRDSVNAVFPVMLKNWQNMKSGGAAVNAGFDVETLFLAKKKNFKITEVPVNWHYVGTERVGIKAAIEALKDMIRIRFDDWGGKYSASHS